MSSHHFWTVTISQRMPNSPFGLEGPAGLFMSPAQPCVPSERSMSFSVWRHPPAPGSSSLPHTSSGWCWVGDGVTEYVISELCLARLCWPWLTPKALCNTSQTSFTAPGTVSQIYTLAPWAQETWKHPLDPKV